MNTIVMYFCGTRVGWIMEHETAGSSRNDVHRIQIWNGTLTKNEEKKWKEEQPKLGVSWVIDKYINYGQLVLMLSDHDSIATGAWVFVRIILSAKDFSVIPYLSSEQASEWERGRESKQSSARKRQEVKTR